MFTTRLSQLVAFSGILSSIKKRSERFGNWIEKEADNLEIDIQFLPPFTIVTIGGKSENSKIATGIAQRNPNDRMNSNIAIQIAVFRALRALDNSKLSRATANDLEDEMKNKVIKKEQKREIVH